MKHLLLLLALLLFLTACASPTAAPTATTAATATTVPIPTPTLSPTETPTPTPTPDPFAGLEYNLAISLGGDFEGYAAAVDNEGQLVAVNGPEGNRLDPNEAGLYPIGGQLWAWNSGAGRLVEAYVIGEDAFNRWDSDSQAYTALFPLETTQTETDTGWITGLDADGVPTGVFDPATSTVFTVEDNMFQSEGITYGWDGQDWAFRSDHGVVEAKQEGQWAPVTLPEEIQEIIEKGEELVQIDLFNTGSIKLQGGVPVFETGDKWGSQVIGEYRDGQWRAADMTWSASEGHVEAYIAFLQKHPIKHQKLPPANEYTPPDYPVDGVSNSDNPVLGVKLVGGRFSALALAGDGSQWVEINPGRIRFAWTHEYTHQDGTPGLGNGKKYEADNNGLGLREAAEIHLWLSRLEAYPMVWDAFYTSWHVIDCEGVADQRQGTTCRAWFNGNLPATDDPNFLLAQWRAGVLPDGGKFSALWWTINALEIPGFYLGGPGLYSEGG